MKAHTVGGKLDSRCGAFENSKWISNCAYPIGFLIEIGRIQIQRDEILSIGGEIMQFIFRIAAVYHTLCANTQRN